jgi:hypothetical protein
MTRFVSLFRPALVAAGGFLFAGNILSLGRPAKFSDAALTPMFEVSSALLLLGAVAVLLALVALHARQADQVGAFGLFAALVAGAGTVLFSGVCWSQTFLDPAAAKVVPAFLDADQPPVVLLMGFYLSLALFAVGWLLYAIATLRAHVFARVPSVVLLIGAILTLLPMLPVGETIIGLSLVWLGVAPAAERVGRVVPAV